ncbi:MAG: response regulator transcription factor [Opitutaceae bacterium]|nr:response regulator transcription factor [Opitutaceae bacterium]
MIPPVQNPAAGPIISLFVGDDHGVMRNGIRLLVERTPDLRLVGEAADGRALVEGVLAHRPDVVVADISMPELNGLEAVRQLRARGYGGRVVLLTSHDERRFVADALAAGVLAYVHKDETFDCLLAAIRAAHRGERWLSPRLAGVLEGDRARTLAELLSPREREVLQLLAEGRNTKEVAHQLGLSAKTVEFHRLNLFAKLKVNGLADLVRIAIKEGLVQL